VYNKIKLTFAMFNGIHSKRMGVDYYPCANCGEVMSDHDPEYAFCLRCNKHICGKCMSECINPKEVDNPDKYLSYACSDCRNDDNVIREVHYRSIISLLLEDHPKYKDKTFDDALRELYFEVKDKGTFWEREYGDESDDNKSGDDDDNVDKSSNGNKHVEDDGKDVLDLINE
jgi:hypothetical protein